MLDDDDLYRNLEQGELFIPIDPDEGRMRTPPPPPPASVSAHRATESPRDAEPSAPSGSRHTAARPQARRIPDWVKALFRRRGGDYEDIHENINDRTITEPNHLRIPDWVEALFRRRGGDYEDIHENVNDRTIRVAPAPKPAFLLLALPVLGLAIGISILVWFVAHLKVSAPPSTVPTDTDAAGAPTEKERLVLVGRVPGNIYPQDPQYVFVQGAWSSSRQWLKSPGNSTEPELNGESTLSEWSATNWWLFALGYEKPATFEANPRSESGSPGQIYYRLRAPAADGVAIAGSDEPVTRPHSVLHTCCARDLETDAPGLITSASEVLSSELSTPVVLESSSFKVGYLVDLDGDGDTEVVWVARSRRDEWWDAEDVRPNDFVVLGLRYHSGGILKHQELAIQTSVKATGSPRICSASYDLLAPVDIDGDGRLEIVASVSDDTETRLLVFTFDGEEAKRVLPP